MIAALNDLKVKCGNLLNTYIQPPVTEKMLTTLDPEFGKVARKTAVIVIALYGLKSTGTAFKSHLARCMKSLGHQSCKTDPDLWLRSEVRSDN